jgi:hypothetical protein
MFECGLDRVIQDMGQWQAVVNTVMNLIVQKSQKMFWPDERLLACQDGFWLNLKRPK